MRIAILAATGALFLIGGGYLYLLQNAAPSCSDATTLVLAKDKLSAQFKYPNTIRLANIRTLAGGLFAHRLECAAEIQGDMLQTGPEPVHYTSEMTDDTRRQFVEAAPLLPTSLSLPLVSCDSDGQVGFVAGPKEIKNVPRVSEWAKRYLAYYATSSIGVLAPRGWSCFSTYGSNGDTLFVAPHALDSDTFFKGDKQLSGPAIQLSVSYAETSGRFAVARVMTRLFPQEQDFVKQVIAEKMEPASDFPMGPFPHDQIRRKNDFVVEYQTPPNIDGEGTQGSLGKDALPISGIVMLVHEGAEKLAVKLPVELQSLTSEILEQTEWQERDHLQLESER